MSGFSLDIDSVLADTFFTDLIFLAGMPPYSN
jgi:hypothetical protein